MLRILGALGLAIATLTAGVAQAATYFPTYNVTSNFRINSIVLAGRGDDPDTEGRYLVDSFQTEPGFTQIVDPFDDDYFPLETFFMGLSNLVPGEVFDSGGEQHFVVALNNFYAASTINQEFGDIFAGFDEASLIAATATIGNRPNESAEALNDAINLLFSFSEFVNAANGDFLIGEGFTLVAFSMGQVIGTGTASATPGVAAVPEPATWALLIGGFGIVGTMQRRRRDTATRVTA